MRKWIGSIILLISSGFSFSQEVGEIVKLEGPESCNQPGRYQIFIHSSMRADQYLVDTCLGRVWQQVNYTDIDKTVWQRVPRVDTSEDLTEWSLKELLKQKAQD